MIHCPNCHKSHYTERYSTSTLLGWSPEYINGLLVDNNPNTTTTYCTCCECHHNFYYTIQYGEIQEVIDEGEPEKVPVIQMPSVDKDLEGKVLQLKENNHIYMKSPQESTAIATNKDIEEINKKLERLTKMVESLWEWNTHDVFEED